MWHCLENVEIFYTKYGFVSTHQSTQQLRNLNQSEPKAQARQQQQQQQWISNMSEPNTRAKVRVEARAIDRDVNRPSPKSMGYLGEQVK